MIRNFTNNKNSEKRYVKIKKIKKIKEDKKLEQKVDENYLEGNNSDIIDQEGSI